MLELDKNAGDHIYVHKIVPRNAREVLRVIQD